MNLLKIEARNFKMFRSFEFSFEKGKNYVISGTNRVGKTTIANMILWNLTGKDIEGRNNFDIRNHDVPPTEEAEVSCEYCFKEKSVGLDGEDVELKRIVRMTRRLVGKFSGSGTNKTHTGDLSAYEIDGVNCTADQYEEMVYKIFNTSRDFIQSAFNIKDTKTRYDISIILNIKDFMYKLSNKEQRHILTSLFSTITDKDVIESDKEKYFEIEKILSEGYTLLDYKRQKEGQISELYLEVGKNDKEGKIQTRISERKKDLLESNIDVEFYKENVKNIQEDIDSLMGKIVKIKNNTEISNLETEIREINNQYEFLKNENEKFKATKRKERFDKIDSEIKELNSKIFEYDRKKALIENDIYNIENKMKMEKFKLENAEEQLNNAFSLSISDSDMVCPTCGQQLPEDDIQKRKIEIENKKEKNVKSFSIIIADCKRNIEVMEKDLQEKKNDLIELSKQKDDYNLINKKISDLKKERNGYVVFENIDGYEEKYQKMLEEISTKKELTNRIKENKKGEILKLEELIYSLKSQKKEAQKFIDLHEKNEITKNRIKELQKELEEKTNALSSAEYICLLIDDFIAKKDNMSENEINSKFQYVEWQMYGKLKGSDKYGEKCVCMIKDDQNNTFESTNKASKINATIDIANAFSKAIGTNIVLVVDDCEGVDVDNFHIETENQLFKMKVISRQPIIMIETEEQHENRIEEEMKLIEQKREQDLLNYEVENVYF